MALDAHLHVWSTGADPYPYARGHEPSPSTPSATVETLLAHMSKAGVGGALIVQPITHQFDHSYVEEQALRKYPGKFVGMALANPMLPLKEALQEMQRLVAAGWRGFRFNPYLFPPVDDAASHGKRMISKTSIAMFKEVSLYFFDFL